MSNFDKAKISKVGEVVTGKTPSTDNEENFGGDVPFITIPDLRNSNRLVKRTDRYLTERGASAMKNQVLPEGAVMMSCLATVGLRGITTGTACTNQQINSVICDRSVCHPEYLYYALETIKPELKAQGGGGSVYLNVSKSKFSNLEVPLPALPVQRRIADILGALDDKIELNRRMNETLEAMAQALYQHWFVDFGPFQDREFKDTEELGAIPKGWDVKPAYDLCDVLTGGTPKTKKDEYWGGDIKWVSAKDISDTGTFVMDTERKVTPTGVEESTTDVLPERTVVVVARGSVGKHCIIGEDMAMNQSCYGLRGREEIGQSWTYLMLNNLIRRLQQVAYGSVFDTITISTFKNTEIVAPPVEIISRFEEKVDPLFDLMHSNVKENQTLAKTRDYLLPKLISGEIEVDAVEKAVETSV